MDAITTPEKVVIKFSKSTGYLVQMFAKPFWGFIMSNSQTFVVYLRSDVTLDALNMTYRMPLT